MADMSSFKPQQYRALLLKDPAEPPSIVDREVPAPTTGQTLLRVLSARTLSYTNEIYQSSAPGYRNYPFPLPIVPGTSAIARVAAVGNDATALRPGQLILFDVFVRSRDLEASSASPVCFLSAIHEGYSDSTRHLMSNGGVRDGAYAEYMLAFLENSYILDEKRLTSPRPDGLGYSFADLNAITSLLVPYGGLRSTDVRPGEIVLIGPATGPFGSAACMVALALGARVIAWGRSAQKLDSLKAKLSSINKGHYSGMIETALMTSDADEDLQNIKTIASNMSGGSVDVYFDISPPAASDSHYMKTGILSLRRGGRVSFMGGIEGDVQIPYTFIMNLDITIKGKWMYSRSNVVEIIKLIEAGILVLGEEGGWDVAGRFNLDQWKEAWDVAAEKSNPGEIVVIEP